MTAKKRKPIAPAIPATTELERRIHAVEHAITSFHGLLLSFAESLTKVHESQRTIQNTLLASDMSEELPKITKVLNQMARIMATLKQPEIPTLIPPLSISKRFRQCGAFACENDSIAGRRYCADHKHLG